MFGLVAPPCPAGPARPSPSPPCRLPQQPRALAHAQPISVLLLHSPLAGAPCARRGSMARRAAVQSASEEIDSHASSTSQALADAAEGASSYAAADSALSSPSSSSSVSHGSLGSGGGAIGADVATRDPTAPDEIGATAAAGPDAPRPRPAQGEVQADAGEQASTAGSSAAAPAPGPAPQGGRWAPGSAPPYARAMVQLYRYPRSTHGVRDRPFFLERYPVPQGRTFNINSFLGALEPYDGKFFVPPRSYRAFLDDYVRAFYNGYSLFLTEAYQKQFFRYFLELDFDWSVDLDVVMAVTARLLPLTQAVVGEFYGQEAPDYVTCIRTPYKVHVIFHGVITTELLAFMCRDKLLEACRAEFGEPAPVDWERVIDFPHGSFRLPGSKKTNNLDRDPDWVRDKAYYPARLLSPQEQLLQAQAAPRREQQAEPQPPAGAAAPGDGGGSSSGAAAAEAGAAPAAPSAAPAAGEAAADASTSAGCAGAADGGAAAAGGGALDAGTAAGSSAANTPPPSAPAPAPVSAPAPGRDDWAAYKWKPASLTHALMYKSSIFPTQAQVAEFERSQLYLDVIYNDFSAYIERLAERQRARCERRVAASTAAVPPDPLLKLVNLQLTIAEAAEEELAAGQGDGTEPAAAAAAAGPPPGDVPLVRVRIALRRKQITKWENYERAVQAQAEAASEQQGQSDAAPAPAPTADAGAAAAPADAPDAAGR